MPSGHPATRQNGVCRGSLWKQHCSFASPSDVLSKNERGKSHEFCILVGNTLTSYPDQQSYQRGDYPSSEIRIVGGSAWSPATGAGGGVRTSSSSSTTPTSTSLHSLAGGHNAPFSPTALAAAAHSPPRRTASGPIANGTTGSSAPGGGTASARPASASAAASAAQEHYNSSPTFRIVTYAGTHVYCVAPTCTDRDVWLSALHSGLEASYASGGNGNGDGVSVGLDGVESAEVSQQQGSTASSGRNAGGNDVGGDIEWRCEKCGGKCRDDGDSGAEPSSASGRCADADHETDHESVGSGASGGSRTSDSSTPSSTSSSSSSFDSDPWLPPTHEHKHRRDRHRVTSEKYPVKQIHVSKPSRIHERNSSLDVIGPMKPPPAPALTTKYCRSCGLHRNHPSCPSPEHFRLYYQACPLGQYNYETKVATEWVCQNCYVGQGLLCEVRSSNGLYGSFFHERAAMRAARGAARLAVRQGVEKAVRDVTNASKKKGRGLDTGATSRSDVEGPIGHDGDAESEGSSHGHSIDADPSGEGTPGDGSQSPARSGSPSLEGSWETVPDIKPSTSPTAAAGGGQSSRMSSTANNNHGTTSGYSTSSSTSSWHQVSPTDAGTSSLLALLQTPGFATLRRRSRALELECLKLENGLCSGAIEFLDILDSLCGPNAQDAPGPGGEVDGNKMEMKKEAFKVAGDMSAAMKLLHDHALGLNVRDTPNSSLANMDTSALLSGSFSSTYTTHGNSIYMLRCILELMLDLCEEGELSAVAFFWPQLRHLHMRMLPPVDADALIRVELLEDFLLTVSSRFSVHLALELAWGCVADLEEAFAGMSLWSVAGDPEGISGGADAGMLGSSTHEDVAAADVSDKCRMRRFAILRFVCELESIMFDFEGGWGGGSVALRGILAPSDHQATLIRHAISTLQKHRLSSPHYLTRSVRRELLLREQRQQQALSIPSQSIPVTPKRVCCHCHHHQSSQHQQHTGAAFASSPASFLVMPKKLLQRNANYFSSQMLFVRRLGDIAEKLRFLHPSKRQGVLKSELDLLNLMLKNERKRGRIAGGDPLSRGETCYHDDDGPLQLDGLGSSGLAPVINVPSKEGHVFRSKARTPILLLMEVIRDDLAPDSAVAQQEDVESVKGDEAKTETTERSDRAATSVGPETDIPAHQTALPAQQTALVDEASPEKASDAVAAASPAVTEEPSSTTVMDMTMASPGSDAHGIPGNHVRMPLADEGKRSDRADLSSKSQSEEENPVSALRSAEASVASTSPPISKPLDRAESPPPSVTIDSIKSTGAAPPPPQRSPRKSPHATPNAHKSTILKRLDSPAPDGSFRGHNRNVSLSSLRTPVLDVAPASSADAADVDNANLTPSRQRLQSVDRETEDLVASVMEEKLSLQDSSALKLPKLEELGLADSDENANADIDEDTIDAVGGRTGSVDSTERTELPMPDALGETTFENRHAPRPGDCSKMDSGRSLGEASDAVHPSSATRSSSLPPQKTGGSEKTSPGNTRKESIQRSVEQVSNFATRKMSALGSAPSAQKFGNATSPNRPGQKPIRNLSALASGSRHAPLAAFGEGRREVLTTILQMPGNVVAKGAAAAAQRTVQAMDRKRAVDLIESEKQVAAKQSDPGRSGLSPMMNGLGSPANEEPCRDPEKKNEDANRSECQTSKGDFEVNFPKQDSARSLGSGSGKVVQTPRHPAATTSAPLPSGSGAGGPNCTPEEEEEAMESLRLVLLQNRVAQGNLTPEHAARALGPDGARTLQADLIASCHEDAGEIDPRLTGCGQLTQGLLTAIKMWKQGVISNGELLELAHKDQLFLRTALPGAENLNKLMDDSAFWVRFAFGERWAEKKARIAARSIHGSEPGWDLLSVIVKSNDDLRQEAFVMQLIELCQEAFKLAGLELWLQPYRIVATGRTTGIIETLQNALSFDSLKKRPGYQGNGGLRGHFIRMAEFAANPKQAFRATQHNFVRSLAAYSLISYLFLFKDRHNGNLLLDTAGHVIHIDFGFVFGIAPGGTFSLEASTPFKLTEEMIEVMGGVGSPLFSEFVTLFCCGFLALQAHVDTFLTLVEITCKDSAFPCFVGKDSSDVVEKLRGRFRPDLNKAATVAWALDIIRDSLTSYGTRQYDFFQYLSQGIAT